MSAERDLMIKSLKLPHFYRKLDNQTDLLMFQFSMYGGVLYVEISKCSSEGYTEQMSGKHILPSKIKVYQIGGSATFNRKRIGKNSDDAFKFNKFNTEKVALEILGALREAEEWWDLYPEWWKK